MKVYNIILILAFGLFKHKNQFVLGEHILFLHTCTSYSHRVSSWPLIEALASKGHQVTFIGPYPSQFPSKENVTDIVPIRLNTAISQFIDTNLDVTNRAYGLTPKFIFVYDAICYIACRELFLAEEFKDWLKTSPKVDLIYSDTVSECAFGLATKLKAKHGLILPLTFISKHVEAFGISGETSTIPDWDISYKPPLSFIGRAVGAVIPLIWHFSQVVYYEYWYKELFRTHLKLENIPSLDEIQGNTSVILINGDFIEDYPRAFPPMVVKVPGLHVQVRNGLKNGPLEKELEEFISSPDENGVPSEGFIYISFGTVAKGPNLPLEIRQAFFKAIESLPSIKFIWRWDGPNPETYPKNLLLKRWVQQENLLGHTKIKAFITQAGRPSLIESFYNSVPTITFPILGDQDFNAHRYETLGISINMDIVGIKEDHIKTAILEIINNPRFSEKAKKLSRFAMDSQSFPVNTAVWWTEFILRNDQEMLSLLRPLSQKMYWYQKRDLDVWAFFVLLLIILIKLMLFTFKKLFFKDKALASTKFRTKKSKLL